MIMYFFYYNIIAMDKNSKEYKRAKQEADEVYEKHSAYKSMFITKRYMELTNKKLPSTSSSTRRWLDEKWISVGDYLDGKIVACGSSAVNSGCRPLIRITKDTPITIEEVIKKHGKRKIRTLSNKKIEGYRISWFDAKVV